MPETYDYPLRSALFTDLYQLTMGQAYTAEGMEGQAVFELFFRKMPDCRNYLVAGGLEDALAYLEGLHFTDDDLAYLEKKGLFSAAFLGRLRQLRFTGDVYAVAEGTPIFSNEPILQVVAPLVEAQLAETYLINQVHFQTVAAGKAARVVAAAAGRDVVEFGARRAHGIDAAMKMARVSYMVGFVGTSNVLAGRDYDIPIFGTMAHSYIQSHDSESEAFVAFCREFPETTLLVDTYDTLGGVGKVIELSRQLGDRFRVRYVRLDSGDLADLAKQARPLLDAAGLNDVRIFATSDLDEYGLQKIIASGAPIDAFGVGTRLASVDDAPHVDMAYKLVEFAGRGRIKLSSTRMKATYPGRKQIFREYDDHGLMRRDVLAAAGESVPGTPLLQPVIKGGQRLPAATVDLRDARRYAQAQLGRLPTPLLRLDRSEPPYEVEISAGLRRERERLAEQILGQ